MQVAQQWQKRPLGPPPRRGAELISPTLLAVADEVSNRLLLLHRIESAFGTKRTLTSACTGTHLQVIPAFRPFAIPP
jgi:hypothetical protein